VSIRKRTWKNGKGESKTVWVVDYVDQGGKRRLKTFERKKEADDFAATGDMGDNLVPIGLSQVATCFAPQSPTILLPHVNDRFGWVQTGGRIRGTCIIARHAPSPSTRAPKGAPPSGLRGIDGSARPSKWLPCPTARKSLCCAMTFRLGCD